ncbi:MAG: hypothetical protein FJ387_13625 [Verrucomicrobia bacterium]|nr:hypothetical protein [Verrucomicrobiota bacterium]
MATVDQVGTLADLRNIIPDPNLARFIKGRTQAGDAGAGIFEWDPNCPAVPGDAQKKLLVDYFQHQVTPF